MFIWVRVQKGCLIHLHLNEGVLLKRRKFLWGSVKFAFTQLGSNCWSFCVNSGDEAACGSYYLNQLSLSPCNTHTLTLTHSLTHSCCIDIKATEEAEQRCDHTSLTGSLCASECVQNKVGYFWVTSSVGQTKPERSDGIMTFPGAVSLLPLVLDPERPALLNRHVVLHHYFYVGDGHMLTRLIQCLPVSPQIHRDREASFHPSCNPQHSGKSYRRLLFQSLPSHYKEQAYLILMCCGCFLYLRLFLSVCKVFVIFISWLLPFSDYCVTQF